MIGYSREKIEALKIAKNPTSSAMLDEYIKGYNHAIYDHEAIEKETVRLLVEALKREHRSFLPSDQPHYEEKCPVCQLIRKHDK